MKSVLCFLAAALMLVACKPSATSVTGPSVAQKNLDAVHAVNKAFETGDVSQLDQVIAADFVDHSDQGDMNRDSLKAYILRVHKSGMPLKQVVLKELADSEYVFAMMLYSGEGDGVLMPKGPFEMHSVEVVRFKDGKAEEHWPFSNMAEMTKMMAQKKEAQAPPAGADSLKKK